MRKAFVSVVSLGILIAVLQTWAQAPQGKYSDPSQFHLAKPGVPIAGIPEEEALKIYERNAEELRKLQGAVSVSFMAEGLVVETANPAVLPPSVERLPVFAVPPVDPRAAGGLDYALSNPPKTEPTPLPEPPVATEPPPPECPSGTYLKPGEGRCRLLNPPSFSDEPELKLLPPPPGVIVLKPGKVRELATTCPEGFEEEVEGYGGWRFCVNPRNPEKIPPLWSPPIAGIPYEEVLAIYERHLEDFAKLPEIESADVRDDGIHIFTNNPTVVPKTVEGVPIIVHPATGRKIKLLSHTYNTQVRPLHGAIFIGQYLAGTLTGVALSDGHPWLIFPAHLIQTCDINPTCPISLSPLNSCPHYYPQQPGQSVPLVVQPPAGSPSLVGFTQRWTRLTGSASNDVAAAYMDADSVEGNGLLSGDRRVATDTSIPFSGIPVPALPPVGLNVTVRSALGPPHQLSFRVQATNHTAFNVQACASQPVNLTNQIRYTPAPGSNFVFSAGDSGSPVFDGAARLVGMINWCELDPQTSECSCKLYPGETACTAGGGTSVQAIQSTLRFDQWYGTASVLDQTIAVFRPSTGWWYVDNGNGRWDGSCNSTGGTTPPIDKCFQYGLGGNIDLPVTGDWDGNGTVTVGVYRTNTNPQQFFLSNNNSTVHYIVNSGPPTFGYQPVVGKWGTPSTTTKVGIFRSSTGEWYLDNGDRITAGCPPDTCFNTSAFTLSGDKPLAGDWDNNGSVTIGVFRPSNSTFYLSNNNSTVAYTLPAGIPSFGYRPVVGNWTGLNGQTSTKLGVFYPSNGTWYLDNGNRVFPGCAEDQCPAGFGITGDWPAALDKSLIKAN